MQGKHNANGNDIVNSADAADFGKDHAIQCDLCGGVYDLVKLAWTEDGKFFCCPECLAEEESCGCSD